MRITLTSLRFTTTVRVIDRVHGRTANGRANTAPTLGTGLAQLEVVLVVADFANGGAALDRHLAHFARAQTQRGIDAFASDQLDGCTGSACDLSAFTRLQLDTVNRRTDRDVAQRQRVSGLDRCIGTGNDLVARLQAFGAMM